MTKLQRIKKINAENESLTAISVREYIDKYYDKNPPKAELLSPLTFIDDNKLMYVLIAMKKTSKLLLTKDYIWEYFRNSTKLSLEGIINYNERKYQDHLIHQILDCKNEIKKQKLIDKLDPLGIRELKINMKHIRYFKKY